MNLGEITIKDKVLLLLLGFPKEKILDFTEMESDHVLKSLPVEISQEGIAETVGIRWNHASRALKELINMNYVEVKKGNIKGGRRSRLVYFLTPLGTKVAESVETMVNNQSFKIVKDGKVENLTFSQVYRQYGEDIPFFDFYIRFERLLSNVVIEGDIYDSLKFNKAMEQIGRVHSHTGLPYTFAFGRENELKLLTDLIESGPKTIVIRGLAGMGKTTLIANFLEDISDHDTLYYPIHEWDSAKGLLMIMASFLEMLKKFRLRDYMKTRGGETDFSRTIDFWEIHEIISQDMRGERFILVFDDFQKASEDVKKLIAMVHSIISGFDNAYLMILSREVPDFYSRKDIIAEKKVFELNIEGLDYNSIVRLLHEKGFIDDSLFPRIYQITGGHPLAVELIGNIGDIGQTDDLIDYIKDEILFNLEDSSSSALRKISVYRNPIPTDFIITDEKDFGIVEKLVSRSLLIQTRSFIEIHDIIKSVVISQLPEGLYKYFHKEAAKRYLELLPDNHLEYSYHLIESDDLDRAFSYILDNLEIIIKSGRGLDLDYILEKIDMKTHQDLQKDYDFIQIDLLAALGRFDESHNLMNKYSPIIERGSPQSSRILLLQAVQLYTNGKWKQCISLMNELLASGIDQDNQDYRMGLFWKGKALIRVGDTAESERILLEALDLSKAASDNYSSGKIMMALALVSDKYFSYGISAAELFMNDNNKYDLAEAKTYLGRYYYKNGEMDKATIEWQQGIEISNQSGNIKVRGIMEYNLAAIFSENNNFHKALVLLRKCTKDFYQISFSSGYVYSRIGYGLYYRFKNNYRISERFLKSAESIAVEFNDEQSLQVVYDEMINLYEAMDKPKDVKKIQRKLERIRS